MTAFNRDLAARVAELGVPLSADRPVLRNSSVIPLPSNWSCAYGASDDEPFCTDDGDDHVCPTIRVHRDDAEQFAALVARVHELEGTTAAIEYGIRIADDIVLDSHVTDRSEQEARLKRIRNMCRNAVLVQRPTFHGEWTEAAR